jgi:hypothetical protein
MAQGDHDPALLAMLDLARAESRNDLAALLAAFTEQLDRRGEARAVSSFTQSLLDAHDWQRLELVTVLVEALARLAVKP